MATRLILSNPWSRFDVRLIIANLQQPTTSDWLKGEGDWSYKNGRWRFSAKEFQCQGIWRDILSNRFSAVTSNKTQIGNLVWGVRNSWRNWFSEWINGEYNRILSSTMPPCCQGCNVYLVIWTRSYIGWGHDNYHHSASKLIWWDTLFRSISSSLWWKLVSNRARTRELNRQTFSLIWSMNTMIANINMAMMTVIVTNDIHSPGLRYSSRRHASSSFKEGLMTTREFGITPSRLM